MTLYKSFLASSQLPWRVRNALETWTEKKANDHFPGLYRFLHLGNIRDRVLPLTGGPRHHFFGYYDKTPWNSSQSLVLAQEAGFNDRAPKADDRVTVGVVHTHDNNLFQPLAETAAWNWQQGALLQWHPADPEKLLIHNDRRNDQHVGIVRDTSGAEIAVYDRPLYAVLPDGKTAFSINFSRLAVHRPGYGYAGLRDPFENDPNPAQDGIWAIGLNSGESQLIVSLDRLAALNPKPSMQGGFHYINHIQPSRGGLWIAFFHIWTTGSKGWEVRLYLCRPDGSQLRCLLDTGQISHYDWLGDDAILVWAADPATGKPHFLHLGLDGGIGIFGEDTLTEDGHCTFSPNRQWVLNDTYPDRFDKRTLMLVKWPEGERIDIARLHSPKSKWWGEIRCDLHPRWSRDGNKICIDSVHEGSRQMYAVDVGDLVA
ncbi:MAG: hypothetical protein K0M66_12755 [Thiobacillus sp.]|nr:hypothetical protein [Thiobacillus sp.]